MRVSLRVPTEWNDITIEQYQKFAQLSDDYDEEQLQNKMLEIFCGVTSLTAMDMTIHQRQEICQKVAKIFDQEPRFIQKFNLYGREYGFHPNLNDMTFGEFIDLEEFQSDPKNLHKLAAILFRPITNSFGSRYEIEPYSANVDEQEKMKRAPAGVVLASIVFFWKLGTTLCRDTLKFLEKMDEPSEARNDSSLRNGDGSRLSTDFVVETLRELMSLQTYPLNSRFFSLVTKATKPNSNES